MRKHFTLLTFLFILFSCSEQDDYSLRVYSTKPEIITYCSGAGVSYRAISKVSNFELIRDQTAEVGYCWVYGAGIPDIESNRVISVIEYPSRYWSDLYDDEYHFESLVILISDTTFTICGYLQTKNNGVIYGDPETINAPGK